MLIFLCLEDNKNCWSTNMWQVEEHQRYLAQVLCCLAPGGEQIGIHIIHHWPLNICVKFHTAHKFD
jgi:hypothetical protein